MPQAHGIETQAGVLEARSGVERTNGILVEVCSRGIKTHKCIQVHPNVGHCRQLENGPRVGASTTTGIFSKLESAPALDNAAFLPSFKRRSG